MISSWMWFFVALLQIILFLDSSSSESLNSDRAPGNFGNSQRARKAYQWAVYSDDPLYRNATAEFVKQHPNPFLKQNARNTSSVAHDTYVPLLRNSSGRLDALNFTVKIRSPFSANRTLIVGDNLQDEAPMIASPLVQDRLDKDRASRSERKCTEYRDGAQSATLSLPLIGTYKSSSIASLQFEPEVGGIRPLVVGGRDAGVREFPHVVALGKLDEEGHFSLLCGGTLISSRWVLTAAHCTHGLAGGVRVARMGIHRLNDTDGVTISIKRTIRHPTYRPPAMYADIALLELERLVSFSKAIKPACLYQQNQNMPTSAWVCGWGATEFGGEESNILQAAALDFVGNVNCAIKHNRSISVPDGVVPSMICAGAPHSNWQQDSCHGDSGGPLQILHPTYSGVYQIVGITSFGSGCAFVESPGVYTRVSHYLDWIENIVWPQGN